MLILDNIDMQYAIIVILLLLLTGCNTIQGTRPVLYKTITISKNNHLYERSDRRSNRLETLKEGEHVNVLAVPGNRWIQVSTSTGLTGWIESRDLLDRSDYEEWEQLAKKVAQMRPQSYAETYTEANLRLRPGRDTTKLIKITEMKALDIYAMAHTVKPGSEPSEATPPVKNNKTGKGKPRKPEGPTYDTWYLVKTSEGMVGWLYAGLAHMKVPEELALHSEGKSIVAWHALNFTKDEKGDYRPNYLSIEREAGSNRDFDRVRFLYWNTRRKRFEMAHRIQNIQGVLPVESTPLEPGKSGIATFRIRYLKTDAPNTLTVDDYQVDNLKVSLLKSSTEPLR